MSSCASVLLLSISSAGSTHAGRDLTLRAVLLDECDAGGGSVVAWIDCSVVRRVELGDERGDVGFDGGRGRVLLAGWLGG